MFRGATVAFGVALALTGCAPATPSTTAGPSARPRPQRSGFARHTPAPHQVAFPAYSATARVPAVVVRSSPGGRQVVVLGDPQPSGAPLVFGVVARQGGWVHVLLPLRPNGSTGWVRAADVTVAGVAYRLDVHRGAHRLDVYRFGALLRSYPVGIGTRETPTPGGVFYLKELLRPPAAGGPYGPFAYGLSGYSNALTSFAGGDGVIGIHGTDHPELVGTDVSHGCIRMRNADITALARELPLGTPVRILS